MAGRLLVAMDMTFPSRNQAGTGVYASELIAALRKRDDVVVAAVGADGAVGLPSTMTWLLRGARKAAASAQLVHCPAGIAPWGLAAPFVLTVHDTLANEFHQDHAFEWRAYAGLVLPRRAKAAARVIVGSECLRTEIIETLGLRAERVAVTPYGIDEGYSKHYARPPRERPLIVFPGAPIQRKSLDLVLDAMAGAQVSSTFARARLSITGAQADDFPRYRDRITTLGLHDRVEWLGRLPQDKMNELVGTADLVVYPSFHEGFGFPALEAMAAGTPVLASIAPCLPDVLGNAALFVSPSDVRAFMDLAEAVLTKVDMRNDLVARGKAHAAHFTWDRCADLTVAVYQEAASSVVRGLRK